MGSGVYPSQYSPEQLSTHIVELYFEHCCMYDVEDVIVICKVQSGDVVLSGIT